MTDRRQEDNDNQLIHELTEDATPGQGSAGGGDLAREIGQRDEFATAKGENAHVTRVQKDDEPTLPNRQETGEE